MVPNSLNNSDAIKNQNNILKEMINGSWNGIGIIDLESNFKYINKAFSPFFGYTEAELLSMKLIDLVLPKLKDPFSNLLKENQTNEYQNRLTIGCLRKDNSLVYLDIFIKLMSNKKAFVLNANDVTVDIAEKKLINQFIIQFHMDTSGNITKASDAFYKLSGFTYDKLVYSSYAKLISSNTQKETIIDFVESIKKGKTWSGNIILNKADGTNFHVYIACKPVKNKYGDVVGHDAVMMDMTSEVMLLKNKDILQEKLIDEEEKLSIMTETMRTVAHEWRQPLNIISLEAQGLAFELDFSDTFDKQYIKERLESISESTEKLSNIINNFQSVTELKGSKKKRHIQDVFLDAIQISDLYEKEFVKEQHEETKSFRTYPKELASALSSILINAKEQIIKKPTGIIQIKTYEQNNQIISEISNNGGHIPAEIIDKIFTPYFSTKEERNGVGLSLYTCKIIIELHLKGKIEVENLEDNWVKFKVSLPIGALEE
jgi:PAS domain S-box-containing protein